MQAALFFVISLFSSVVGAICGVGGGVVIKPMLDAVGNMGVSAVSFLSGCTVLFVSAVSVLGNRKAEGMLELKTSTPLAIGAVVGGFGGKALFELAKSLLGSENDLGIVQAGLFFIVLAAALLYALFGKKLRTLTVKNVALCGIIGMLLGALSAFLGIGGGPINLSVLGFFFSMDTKKAAANSLYIILFSQVSGLIQTFVHGAVPAVFPPILVLMIAGALLGGFVGHRIQRKISESAVKRLFVLFVAAVIAIDVRNLFFFILAR